MPVRERRRVQDQKWVKIVVSFRTRSDIVQNGSNVYHVRTTNFLPGEYNMW